MKKQIVTNREIERDIVYAYKHPADISKATNDRWAPWGIVIALALLAIGLAAPFLVLWFFLAAVALVIGYAVLRHIRIKRLVERISIDDYRMERRTVTDRDEEAYRVRGSRKNPGRHIRNYTLYFEGGDVWRVPKDNYPWCVERPMSDFAIYQSTQVGDEYIVVTEAHTGKIVMAYHTDLFEYRV